MGKLIVLEGSDCSGKSTQFALLKQALESKLEKFKTINFPRYDNQSSYFIKKYLSGGFGENPTDVNSYAGSAFFSLDRYASFIEDWGGDYKNNFIILSDRYTTSNAVHQGSKISENSDFLEWLFDFEYNKLGIPKPDLVFFLDMPPNYSFELLKNRTCDTKDIHEKDENYLIECYNSSIDICEKYNWIRINCIKNGKIRDVHDIHQEILNKILRTIC